MRIPVLAMATGGLLVLTACSGQVIGLSMDRQLHEDVLINADIWDEEPKILGAGLGFTDINGVPGLSIDDLEATERLTRLAGGAWSIPVCGPDEEPVLGNYTASVTPEGVALTFGEETYFADGYPVEFSWPYLASTLDPTDFALTLNTGEVVTPEVASIVPNWELNERSTAVIFGQFGNRLDPSSEGLIWPVSLEIVADETPLTLVGPDGQTVSAVGMTFQSPPPSSYTDPDVAPEDRGGPKLVAAKLTRMSTEGEGWDGGPRLLTGTMPNDGVSLYGDEAEYRLRVFTSGGMTRNGVQGLTPDAFEQYFRVRGVADDGTEVLLTETGVDYPINGGVVRVLGLADLGQKADTYTDCYAEDRDNQIDIILTGDDDAVRAITHAEIPSTDGYLPLYNPGGPGNDPTPGVRYAAGTAPISQEVWVTLDDPRTVTYE
jgi:hypothetical protein